MIMDTLSMFSDAQALSGASVEGEKVLDLGKNGLAETEVFIVARFDTDSHGCTKVEIQGSDDNSTFTTLMAAAVNDTTAGAGVNMRLPQGCPQYLKAIYTGASMTGNVTCGVTLAAPSPRGHRITDYAASKATFK